MATKKSNTKAAPKTAGKIIADGILNIIKEERYG